MTSLTELVLTVSHYVQAQVRDCVPPAAVPVSTALRGYGLQGASRRELPVRYPLHEAIELGASHVYEGAVIAALKIDVRSALQVRVATAVSP